MSVFDHVTFEAPKKKNGDDLPQELQDELVLGKEEQARIAQALEEVYATPEGKALLEGAAAISTSDQIHIVANPGGITMSLGRGVVPNMIIIGDQDISAQYVSPKTGEYHDMTYQRMIFHELYHFAAGHGMIEGRFNLPQEAETIKVTNDFMAKYYEEAPRSTDYSRGRLGGTEVWDLSPDFNAAAAELGPDIETRLNIEPVADAISVHPLFNH